MIRPFPWARAGSRAFAGVLALATSTSLMTACLRRDVVSMEPTTKTSFVTQVPQPSVDKVDLIVLVDNSSSMADKQRILADALPDLLDGLVRPRCVDKKTRASVGVRAEPTAAEGEQCPAGSEPAFPPITDMHIGVLSSSLGGMGSNVCDGVDHPNDHGHLLARGENDTNVAAAGDLHFLAWYPPVPENDDKDRHPDPPVPKTTNLDDLGKSFRELVVGVGQDGCGFEAQLESVYHFLVQPDPWTDVTVDPSTNKASYGAPGDVDREILQQRAAFLRPDSLVAVIVLSDEDDSALDPLSFDGTGWVFGDGERRMSRATSACETDPSSSACVSCFCTPADSPTCIERQKDPSCAKGLYTEPEDKVNVRLARMKQRFGAEPQYPISRYVDAFTKQHVPSRGNEHRNGSYGVDNGDCTNPLFAARLPSQAGDDMCKLPLGPRTKDLVYFAVIGGVPNELLDADPAKVDWEKILGKDPSRWDETGIDPHMIPSITPRATLPPPGSADNADSTSGREWDTKGNDLQYACVFDLYERTADGGVQKVERTCEGNAVCDCDGDSDTPLCSAPKSRTQVRGKAYPTRRELMVVKGLEGQGVAASLCPKQLTRPDDEDYGYRPAANAIVSRLERGLLGSCLPRPLIPDADGKAPCLTLAILPKEGPDSDCQRLYGLENPQADLLARLREQLVADEGEASRNLPICVIPEQTPAEGQTCRDIDAMGYCYSHGQDGFGCADALLFTKPTRRLGGARFLLQCIQVGESQ